MYSWSVALLLHNQIVLAIRDCQRTSLPRGGVECSQVAPIIGKLRTSFPAGQDRIQGPGRWGLFSRMSFIPLVILDIKMFSEDSLQSSSGNF
ncbi:hypothetical protein C8R41DRAFT_829070 [Lentinula lateritia]|uniref:Uncharacterized protein n=1 Tax=Lentinula lateritia TaxID=40482 RepID=A0ABQ8VHP1_9AGAR|nr:hypothetical protein C8R41DRAFT_829070 [Lentinula lateritia]